eukprot:10807342-Alexandrium_andersonii.AAC.1
MLRYYTDPALRACTTQTLGASADFVIWRLFLVGPGGAEPPGKTTNDWYGEYAGRYWRLRRQ